MLLIWFKVITALFLNYTTFFISNYLAKFWINPTFFKTRASSSLSCSGAVGSRKHTPQLLMKAVSMFALMFAQMWEEHWIVLATVNGSSDIDTSQSTYCT